MVDGEIQAAPMAEVGVQRRVWPMGEPNQGIPLTPLSGAIKHLAAYCGVGILCA